MVRAALCHPARAPAQWTRQWRAQLALCWLSFLQMNTSQSGSRLYLEHSLLPIRAAKLPRWPTMRTGQVLRQQVPQPLLLLLRLLLLLTCTQHCLHSQPFQLHP
jgi:hypothetical protein